MPSPSKFRPDWFLTGMIAAVLLAILCPGPGAKGGFLHPELLTKLGVALIFFLHGLLLSFGALKAGTMRWPVHLLVQASTFVLFPILGFAFIWFSGNAVSLELKLGFFYLCALPSTVSSSVAMTAAARGNVPVAVFNATLSGLIGVFLTPFWISLMLKGSGHPISMGKVVLDLVIWLILPLILGQLARPLLGGWAARNKKFVNKIDRTTILILVYTSFCDSVRTGVWTSHGLFPVVTAFFSTSALFIFVMLLMLWTSTHLGFSAEDWIAAVFCGSKKSLASGVPMAQLIFGTQSDLSMILLPIMIYHPLQLIVCGALASRWSRRVEKMDTTLVRKVANQ
jgi:solute carrier family 10 (sodium/bile acid cotransporter), member 7